MSTKRVVKRDDFPQVIKRFHRRGEERLVDLSIDENGDYVMVTEPLTEPRMETR